MPYFPPAGTGGGGTPGTAKVRAATTANITIATALNNGDTLDGVTLATDDLVLVKNQSTGAQNGVYTVGAVPARASTFDTWDELVGALIVVEEGTANADTIWLNTNDEGGTLDTTAVTFSQQPKPGSITTSGLTMSTARMLGRTTASTGAIEEITVGLGLSLASGSLTANAGAWTDVASAASVDLSAVASNNIRITGTTQIDGFVIAEGRVVNIRFEGALQVTYNATSLILEGTQSITTAANDRLQIIGLGSNNTFGFNFKRADGTPLKLNALYGSDGATRLNVSYSAIGAGTNYSLTNSAAALNFGTTDTPITIASAGTYRLSAGVTLLFTGATVVAETATLKVRRTNNTAADILTLPVIDLPVMTTLTHTYGVFTFPRFEYVATAGDILELYGQVSATLGAGTVDAVSSGTWLFAERAYE